MIDKSSELTTEIVKLSYEEMIRKGLPLLQIFPQIGFNSDNLLWLTDSIKLSRVSTPQLPKKEIMHIMGNERDKRLAAIWSCSVKETPAYFPLGFR